MQFLYQKPKNQKTNNLKIVSSKSVKIFDDTAQIGADLTSHLGGACLLSSELVRLNSSQPDGCGQDHSKGSRKNSLLHPYHHHPMKMRGFFLFALGLSATLIVIMTLVIHQCSRDNHGYCCHTTSC